MISRTESRLAGKWHEQAGKCKCSAGGIFCHIWKHLASLVLLLVISTLYLIQRKLLEFVPKAQCQYVIQKTCFPMGPLHRKSASEKRQINTYDVINVAGILFHNETSADMFKNILDHFCQLAVIRRCWGKHELTLIFQHVFCVGEGTCFLWHFCVTAGHFPFTWSPLHTHTHTPPSPYLPPPPNHTHTTEINVPTQDWEH